MPKDFLKGFEEEPMDFLQGFLLEPEPAGVVRSTVCPPIPDPTSSGIHVLPESYHNYQTMLYNGTQSCDEDQYGLTGLMAVNTWTSNCYGDVNPGNVFLFPGIFCTSPPAYNGTVSLNCQPHAPLDEDGDGTFHGQMCAILGQPTTNFIGFAVKYPYNVNNSVGYNSGTCNPYWFGSREVSTDCDGTNWQEIIYNALLFWLPCYWIVYAGYGMNDKYNNVTAPVQSQYQKRQSFFVASSADYGPDLDPNMVKTLWIVYASAQGGFKTTLFSTATTDGSTSPARVGGAGINPVSRLIRA